MGIGCYSDGEIWRFFRNTGFQEKESKHDKKQAGKVQVEQLVLLQLMDFVNASGP